ncbi:MAG: MFS transporter [Actinomycetota bacterium]
MAVRPGDGTAPEGVAPADREALVAEVDRLRERFPRYPKRYLYILMAVGAVDAADRTILATVSEDVRLAFDVGDDEIGLLLGAYALVAAVSALPFGFIADRWNRVRLIALGFLPWSIAMFWTGAAQSFGMMFAARLFLGSIEATNGPSTPSLLGDYYPVKERSRAFGINNLGMLLGAVLGFAAAGILADAFDWRAAFYAWGAAGLLCGAAVWKLLPEPQRGLPDALHRAEEHLAASTAPAPPTPNDEALGSESPTVDYRVLRVWPAIREIVRVPTMWITFLAGVAGEFFFSALGSWAPAFFRRYHGFSAGGAGTIVAVLALSVVGGIVTGARLSDRQLARGAPAARMNMAGAAYIGAVVSLMIAFGFDSLALVVPFFLVSGFLIGLPMAPLNAVQLDIIVPQLRGRAAGIRSVMRVVAVGAAPILFGYLSEQYGLRSAMLQIAPTLGVAGLIVLLAARTYPRDMAYAQGEALRQQRLENG